MRELSERLSYWIPPLIKKKIKEKIERDKWNKDAVHTTDNDFVTSLFSIPKITPLSQSAR